MSSFSASGRPPETHYWRAADRCATADEHYSSATSNASFLTYGCTLARDICTCEPLTTRTVFRCTFMMALSQ